MAARVARLSPVVLISPLPAGCAAGSSVAPMPAVSRVHQDEEDEDDDPKPVVSKEFHVQVPASYVQKEQAEADLGFLNKN